MKKIINARVITPFRCIENCEVAYEKGKITGIGENLGTAERVVDAEGMYLSPGFIDLHIHGGGGFSFCEADEGKIRQALLLSAEHGVTSVFASHKFPLPELGKILWKVMNDSSGPEILGMHSECLDWDYIYGEPCNQGKEAPAYTPDKYVHLIKQIPALRKIGVDPSLKGAAEFTRFFTSSGIKVAISHCGPATYEQVMECVEAGADCVTHLYTGMSGVYRDQQTGERFPGVIEDCLMEPELIAEVIGNGRHLTGQMLNLIYRFKGTGGMYLTTDSAVQKEPFKEGEEMVVPNHLPDRISIKTMAPMDYIVRETVKCSDIPLLQAVRMATYNPAKMAGVSDRKGKIGIGYDADLIVFDEGVNVKLVIARGKVMKNELEFI